MADDSSSLHIDTDWKKQAQEEKKRLAEAAQKREEQERATRATPAVVPPTAPAAATGAARGGRETPPASLAALVQSVWTQAMLYLGEIAPSGMEPMLNLDMARHQIDLLGVLEQKTQGNLTEEESRFLDSALYETRARFINVASQYI